MEETPLKKRKRRLEEEIARSKEANRLASNALINLVDNCQHKWGETTNADIYHKAYTIPGDEPGTMGVDHRGPCYVSAKTDKRWQRVCDLCGHVEYTSRVEEIKTSKPKW